MPIKRPQYRLIWFLLLLGLQSLYYPINRSIVGGFRPETALDAYIPLWPMWVVPYILWGPWWMLSFAWAAWKMDDARYRAFVSGALVMMIGAFACFILLPTYVERPFISGNDIFSQWLHLIYTHDRLNNALPSGHVYIATFIALFWRQWYPRYRWLWNAIVATIFLATLFTQQHYLLDAAAGVAFGWFGYRFGLWYENLPDTLNRHPVTSRDYR